MMSHRLDGSNSYLYAPIVNLLQVASSYLCHPCVLVSFIYNLPRFTELEVVKYNQGEGLLLKMVGDHDDSDISEEIRKYANDSDVFKKQDVYHLRPTELSWVVQVTKK